MSLSELERQLRASGFTGAAMNYPLSLAGVRAVAAYNGVKTDQVPTAFFYAPNQYMREWFEALGRRLEAGQSIWKSEGRVFLPSELT